MQKDLNRFFENYEKMVLSLLEVAKKKLPTFLKRADVNLTDCGIFSVLQHYGTPTPFVDWSADYKTALYFASCTEQEKIGKRCSPESPSTYISVYWLEVGNGPETPNNDLTDIGMTLNEFYQNEAIDLNSNKKKFIIEQFRNMTQWGYLPWFFSDKYFPLVDIQNPRQHAQNGGFFYSGNCNID